MGGGQSGSMVAVGRMQGCSTIPSTLICWRRRTDWRSVRGDVGFDFFSNANVMAIILDIPNGSVGLDVLPGGELLSATWKRSRSIWAAVLLALSNSTRTVVSTSLGSAGRRAASAASVGQRMSEKDAVTAMSRRLEFSATESKTRVPGQGQFNPGGFNEIVVGDGDQHLILVADEPQILSDGAAQQHLESLVLFPHVIVVEGEGEFEPGLACRKGCMNQAIGGLEVPVWRSLENAGVAVRLS